MLELRFSTFEPFAMQILQAMDTTGARQVDKDGNDIVVLFALSDVEVQNRIDQAQDKLEQTGTVASVRLGTSKQLH